MLSKRDLSNVKDELLKNNKKSIPSDLEKYYDVMELFDRIHERSEPFDFESIGIKSIQLNMMVYTFHGSMIRIEEVLVTIQSDMTQKENFRENMGKYG